MRKGFFSEPVSRLDGGTLPVMESFLGDLEILRHHLGRHTRLHQIQGGDLCQVTPLMS